MDHHRAEDSGSHKVPLADVLDGDEDDAAAASSSPPRKRDRPDAAAVFDAFDAVADDEGDGSALARAEVWWTTTHADCIGVFTATRDAMRVVQRAFRDMRTTSGLSMHTSVQLSPGVVVCLCSSPDVVGLPRQCVELPYTPATFVAAQPTSRPHQRRAEDEDGEEGETHMQAMVQCVSDDVRDHMHFASIHRALRDVINMHAEMYARTGLAMYTIVQLSPAAMLHVCISHDTQQAPMHAFPVLPPPPLPPSVATEIGTGTAATALAATRPMEAFMLATDPRCGAESPAALVTRDSIDGAHITQEIARLVRDHPTPATAYAVFDDFHQRWNPCTPFPGNISILDAGALDPHGRILWTVTEQHKLCTLYTPRITGGITGSNDRAVPFLHVVSEFADMPVSAVYPVRTVTMSSLCIVQTMDTGDLYAWACKPRTQPRQPCTKHWLYDDKFSPPPETIRRHPKHVCVAKNRSHGSTTGTMMVVVVFADDSVWTCNATINRRRAELSATWRQQFRSADDPITDISAGGRFVTIITERQKRIVMFELSADGNLVRRENLVMPTLHAMRIQQAVVHESVGDPFVAHVLMLTETGCVVKYITGRNKRLLRQPHVGIQRTVAHLFRLPTPPHSRVVRIHTIIDHDCMLLADGTAYMRPHVLLPFAAVRALVPVEVNASEQRHITKFTTASKTTVVLCV